MRLGRGLGLLITPALVLAACTSSTPLVEPKPTESPAPTSSPPATEATLYFILSSQERVFVSPEPQQIGGADLVRARIEALMGSLPVDPDLSTAFPAGIEVRSVTVSGSIATVDFGPSILEAEVDPRLEEFAVQQIAWTLADAIGISAVRFSVEGLRDGEASNGRDIQTWWGNARLENLEGEPDPFALAPITIEEPREGEEVSGRVQISGEARVFEANVTIRILDAGGEVVEERSTPASAGAPERGGWSTEFTFPAPGTWTIEAVEISAQDGSDAFVQTRSVEVL